MQLLEEVRERRRLQPHHEGAPGGVGGDHLDHLVLDRAELVVADERLGLLPLIVDEGVRVCADRLALALELVRSRHTRVLRHGEGLVAGDNLRRDGQQPPRIARGVDDAPVEVERNDLPPVIDELRVVGKLERLVAVRDVELLLDGLAIHRDGRGHVEADQIVRELVEEVLGLPRAVMIVRDVGARRARRGPVDFAHGQHGGHAHQQNDEQSNERRHAPLREATDERGGSGRIAAADKVAERAVPGRPSDHELAVHIHDLELLGLVHDAPQTRVVAVSLTSLSRAAHSTSCDR